jgi:dihydrodipicolinate synthase/N-acetylneuraminate lyase
VNGTTGEGNYSLTVEERLTLAEAWMKEKEQVPHILIQVGGCNFHEAKILVSFIHKLRLRGVKDFVTTAQRP